MILISHRGNINGPIPERENLPQYIDEAIAQGYDVEIDIWMIKGEFFLGHDNPQYGIGIEWIASRAHRLWVHCKNIEAMSFLNRFDYDINYFWHEEDTVTLTSKGYIWAYPGKQPVVNSIAVMPEVYDDQLVSCLGVCSDFIQKYKQ